MYKLKSILVAAFACFAISVFAADKINMKLNLNKGDSYRVIMPIKMPMEINIKVDEAKMKDMLRNMGIEEDSINSALKEMNPAEKEQNISMDINLEMSLIFKVTSANKGKYTIEAYYEYLEGGVISKDETFLISTRKKCENLNEKQQKELDNLKSIIGKKFNIQLNDKGKITALSGYEKINKSLDIKKSSNPFENDNSALTGQLSEDEMKVTLKNIFDIYPDGEVGVNNTWTREYKKVDELAPYRVKTKYTLKSILADKVEILSESIFYTDKDDSKMIEMDGVGSGSITLNTSDFLQQNQPYQYFLPMKMNFMGMVMQMNTHATGVYKVEKL